MIQQLVVLIVNYKNYISINISENLRNLMDQEINTFTVIKQKLYTLQLITQGTSTVLRLTIKTSRFRTEIYEFVLNSLRDVDNLEHQFKDIQQFRQYVQESSNVRVNLNQKSVSVIERTNRSKKIVSIATIPLQLETVIEKEEEEELLNTILKRTSSKEDLKNDEIKQFFQTIAICLSQLFGDKKIMLDHQKLLEQKIQQIYQEAKAIKTHTSVGNQNYYSNYQSELIEQKKYRMQKISEKNKQESIQEIKQSTKEDMSIKNQILEIKKTIESDINGLNMKIERAEKKVVEIEGVFLFKQKSFSHKAIQLEQFLSLCSPTYSWIDPETRDFKDLTLNSHTITAQCWVYAFGKKKIVDQSEFSVKFTKINGSVGVGVANSEYKKFFSGNSYLRYYNNGDCFDGNDCRYNQGNKFKVGEKLTVAVNLEEGVIQWRVDKKIRFQLKSEMLKDKSLNWVPFIQLCSINDSVEIIQ